MYKSYRSLSPQKIGDSFYSPIEITDTQFVAIISPSVNELYGGANNNEVYAAHIFKEYHARNIAPIPNYFRFLESIGFSKLSQSRISTKALRNALPHEVFIRYESCVLRWAKDRLSSNAF